MSSLRSFARHSRLAAWAAGLFAACLLAVGVPSGAQARVWTSTTGQKTTGEFVRMHEGMVVLKVGTKIVKISPRDFCNEDINYLISKVPPDQIDQLPNAPAMREWRDAKGNTVSARLMGFKDGKVVLLREGPKKKPLEVPFERLAAADQAQARKELEARGLGDKLPEVSDAEAQAAAEMPADDQFVLIPGNPQPTAPQAPPMAGSNVPSLRESMRQRREAANERARQMQAEFAENRRKQQQAFEEMRQRQQLAMEEAQRQHQAAVASMNQPPQQAMSPTQTTIQQPQSLSPQQQRMAPPHPPQMARTAPTQGMFCSNCKKQVPASIHAGDSCPHCGIFFGQKQSPNGKVETAANWGFIAVKLAGMVVAALVIQTCCPSKRG